MRFFAVEFRFRFFLIDYPYFSYGTGSLVGACSHFSKFFDHAHHEPSVSCNKDIITDTTMVTFSGALKYWTLQGSYHVMIVLVVAVFASNLGSSLFPATGHQEVPDEWWLWREGEIWNFLDCDEIIDAGRPVLSHNDWVLLRKAYRRVVGTKSTILPTDDVDGFHVPIIAQVTPDKGRGVFAAKVISKGSLVWSPQHQSAQFLDAHSFRQFLASIPPDMACDVLQWAYVEDLGENGMSNLIMSCDLDEGSYMNTGGWDDGIEANVGCDEELEAQLGVDCGHNYYALRDIQAGEEILCDYATFDAPKGWDRFGL